ncbi:MAG: hypothetical protein LRY55_03335 [Leadbetterella sp.]|nr:hypothetical protein [Leadbetterella sp.]
MNQINRLISSVHRQLHVSAWIRCLLAGMSAGLLTYTFGVSVLLGLTAGLAGFTVCALVLKPWMNKKNKSHPHPA